MRTRGTLFGIAVAAALGMGCGNGLPENQAVQRHVGLTAFSQCNELESYVKDSAVLQMRSQLLQAKEGYGWWGYRGDVMMEASADAGAAAAQTPSGPSAYTTTNTQVEGVDEADFVKNDGTRIFALSGGTLYVVKSWPAAELALQSRVAIEGYPQQMFLAGNKVVVFSTVYTPDPYETDRQIDCAALGCLYYNSNTVKITVVDVSNLSAPTVAEEFYQPGWYSNARRVGDSIRMVTGDSFRWPSEMQWYPEYSPLWELDRGMRNRAFDDLISRNEKLIREQPLARWLPDARFRRNGQIERVSPDCGEFNRSNAPSELGFFSVVTLDLAPTAPSANGHPTVSRTSLIANTGEIYATADALYVASSHWWWWPLPGQIDYTYIHKFDLSDPGVTRYVASGGVEGHLLDQFSMDEHDGALRVATTLTTREKNGEQWWMNLTNQVTVLAEKDHELVQVGSTGHFADGERVTSARFIGNRGFVTTFRNVDPLFTFDLADPTQPRIIGELTLPGFSTYMHPLDENHLLTIGNSVPTTGGWPRRVELNIFDVTDFEHPVRTFNVLVGNVYGYSEALWEHKAFNYFPAKKQLSIPFFDWSANASGDYYWSSFVTDLRVFDVDVNTGITARGTLDMSDLYRTYRYNNWTWYWTPDVRRSVMADDFVYAISDAGIRVANVNALNVPLATVSFDRAD